MKTASRVPRIWMCFVQSVVLACLLISNWNGSGGSGYSAAEAISTANVPQKRRLLKLPNDSKISAYRSSAARMPLKEADLRVLQFNILADGLSGLRDDLGLFSRAKSPQLDWSKRRWKLLREITQYDPDIVTLQEVDHYYDFLLPELNALGYTGLFSPKPTSKCLEVSPNADGCALFVKNSKLRIKSCQTATLALSKAEMNEEGEVMDDDIRAQNQVALLAVCELVDESHPQTAPAQRHRGNQNAAAAAIAAVAELAALDEAERLQRVMTRSLRDGGAAASAGASGGSGTTDAHGDRTSSPPIIICTTHLKSAKSATGERYRKRGLEEVLASVTTIYNYFTQAGRTPAVLIAGDFNAQPEMAIYGSPETYRAIQRHPLSLRSVYNEDVGIGPVATSSADFYTTWKARVRGTSTEEIVIKRCIDYIFYKPFVPGSLRKSAFVRSSDANGGVSARTHSSRSRSSTDQRVRSVDGGDGDSAFESAGAPAAGVDSSGRGKNRWLGLVDKLVSTSFLTLLLRFSVYSLTSLFGFSATFLSTDLSETEKWLIALIFGTLALLFENSSYSKPITDASQNIPIINGKNSGAEYGGGDDVNKSNSRRSLGSEGAANGSKNKRRKYAVAHSTATLLKSVVLRLSIYIISAAFILVLLVNGIENSNEQAMERSFALCVALASFVILYESTALGTPFKAVADPNIALREGAVEIDSNSAVISRASSKPSRRNSEREDSENASEDDSQSVNRKGKNEISGKVFDYSSKLLSGISRQLTSIGQWIQPQYGNPGFIACAAVDVYSPEEIGPDFIPSDSYPSDHLALVADLKLLWESSAADDDD